MKTVKIKGKDYAPVNERIIEFRKLYPSWNIATVICNVDDSSVIIKAIVTDEEGKIRATGHAQEDRTSSMINKTSYVENCETSAIGRALGILGIGIDGSIASADELNYAIERQETLAKKVGKVEIATLRQMMENKGTDEAMMLSYYEAEKIEDLTYEQFLSACKILEKK